jgi:hypothetical protein
MGDLVQIGNQDFRNSSKALWALLTEGDDAGKALFALSRNVALREEAARILPSLEGAKEPTTREEFARTMAAQKLVYGIGEMAPEAWITSMEIYFEALKDFSAEALRDAFLRWGRGEDMKDSAMAQFFPKPAQLVMLARKSKAEIYVAAYRARKALDQVEREGPAWTPERKRQERQKMIEQGLLTPDGKPNFTIGAKSIPAAPRVSQHELADRLRRQGVPINRPRDAEEGEVL